MIANFNYGKFNQRKFKQAKYYGDGDCDSCFVSLRVKLKKIYAWAMPMEKTADVIISEL